MWPSWHCDKILPFFGGWEQRGPLFTFSDLELFSKDTLHKFYFFSLPVKSLIRFLKYVFFVVVVCMHACCSYCSILGHNNHNSVSVFAASCIRLRQEKRCSCYYYYLHKGGKKKAKKKIIFDQNGVFVVEIRKILTKKTATARARATEGRKNGAILLGFCTLN